LDLAELRIEIEPCSQAFPGLAGRRPFSRLPLQPACTG
jgi:hypothetical protein